MLSSRYRKINVSVPSSHSARGHIYDSLVNIARAIDFWFLQIFILEIDIEDEGKYCCPLVHQEPSTPVITLARNASGLITGCSDVEEINFIAGAPGLSRGKFSVQDFGKSPMGLEQQVVMTDQALCLVNTRIRVLALWLGLSTFTPAGEHTVFPNCSAWLAFFASLVSSGLCCESALLEVLFVFSP